MTLELRKESGDIKVFDKSIEKKLDLILEKQDLIIAQNEATQRAIALLKADFREIVKESIQSVLYKRAIEGYSKIAGGK